MLLVFQRYCQIDYNHVVKPDFRMFFNVSLIINRGHINTIGVKKCALSRICSHVRKYVCDCVTCVLQYNSDKRMEVKNSYMSLSSFEHV